MVNDVSRAYMYALCDEDVYVELCDEDREAGEEQMCGKLSKAMYGTRIAAKMWQREAGNTLKGAGFTAGRTSPCLFHHPARDMMVFLHGDDLVSSGSVEDEIVGEGFERAVLHQDDHDRRRGKAGQRSSDFESD